MKKKIKISEIEIETKRKDELENNCKYKNRCVKKQKCFRKRRRRCIAIASIAVVALMITAGIRHGVKIMASNNQYTHAVQSIEKEFDKAYGKREAQKFNENYKGAEINYIYPEQKDKEVENIIKSQMKERAYSTVDDIVKKKENAADKKLILVYSGSNVTDRIISFTVDQKIYRKTRYDFKMIREVKEPHSIIDGKTGKSFEISELFKENTDPMPVINQRTKEELMKSGKFDINTVTELANIEYPDDVLGSGIEISDQGLKVPVNAEKYGINFVNIPMNRLLSIIKPEFLDEECKNILANNDLENLANNDIKRVALTFDDGPMPGKTDKVLKILKDNDSKGTFYLLGGKVLENPEMVKKIADEGHELGNHSWSHANLLNINPAQINEEIFKTSYAIYQASNRFPESVRPPYGAINARVAKQIDMPISMWSIDTEDWTNKGDHEKIYRNAISSVKSGDIILFHDIYDSSVKAIEKTVKKLKADGYELVTVSELYNFSLKPEKVYHNIKTIRDLEEEESVDRVK